MKKRQKRIWSIVLSFALILSGLGVQGSLSLAKPKLKLNKKSVTLKAGKKLKLKVENTKKKVKWRSNKKKIATVSSKGVVKAKKKGKAKLPPKWEKGNWFVR